MLQYVGLGIMVALIAYISVAATRVWMHRQQILDIPNDRSSHSHPTPRGGGLVIVVLSTIGLLVAWFLYPVWSFPTLCTGLAGIWLVAAVSWMDDLRSLSNRVRFTAHTLAGILIIVAFGSWRIVNIPQVGPIDLAWLGLPITFVWMVGLTNAYNFMDGIDGIAGGQAVVAGLGWVIVGLITDQPLIAVFGTFVAASSLGFLGHNWPPARIFMGDVGSAFLGFVFAFMAVAASRTDPRLAVVGIILVWPFVFDSGFTFFRRLLNRENVFSAHRSHLYQRLVIAGYSHRFVSSLYIGLAIIGLLLALGWVQDFPFSAVGITVIIPLLCLALWLFVVRTEALYRWVSA